MGRDVPSQSLPPYDGLVIDKVETVWDGRFPLQRVAFRNRRFDGAMSAVRVWELWRRGRAASVLPYDPVSDQVVVIEQFRLPALAAGQNPVMVELPAGLAETGEDAEAIVHREAQEEMGLSVDRLHRIGAFLLTPGGADEECTLFAGRVTAPAAGDDGLIGFGGLAVESEDIRVRALPAEQAIASAIAGEYPNSVTTIGLLWLAAKRDWLRREWGHAA
jgi:ADP-ribose pyrophosphatase